MPLEDVSFLSKYCKLKNVILKKKQGERSSRPEVSCTRGVLKKFVKFTGKNLCWSLFFNKVTSLSLQVYRKQISVHVFSCKFCEIFKDAYFVEHLRTAASEGDSPNIFDFIDKLLSLVTAPRIWQSHPIWTSGFFCRCN